MDRRKVIVMAMVVLLFLVCAVYTYRQLSEAATVVAGLEKKNPNAESPTAAGRGKQKDQPAPGKHSLQPRDDSSFSELQPPLSATTPIKDETREALQSPAIIIRGKVYMPDKSPAKNAPVSLLRQENTFPTGSGGAGHPSQLQITDLDSTLTDQEGRYEVGAKDTNSLVLQASAEGTAFASLAIRPANLALMRRKDGVLVVDQDVRLKGGTSLCGIVIDGEDKPLANVEVTAYQASLDLSRTRSRADIRATRTTDGEGKFVFDQFTDGPVNLRAGKSGYSPVTLVAKRLDDEVKMLMKQGGAVVAGKVLRMGAEAPIGHAQVQLFERLPVNMGNTNSFEMDSESAEDGAFRIENIPAGNYMLVAQTDNLRLVSSDTGKAPDFALAENEVHDDFILYLGSGVTFRGTVSDVATKQPIEGATVSSMGLLDRSRKGRTTTDAEGKYMLENVFGQMTYGGDREAQLTASKSGYSTKFMHGMRTGNAVKLSPAQTEATQDIELYRTVPVSGRVVTTQGAPVVGAKVTIESNSNMDVLEPTDALGRFTIPMIANEKGQLRVNAADFAITFSEAFDVKDRPLNDLVVKMDPGATVIARVVNGKQEKIANAKVWIMVRTYGDNWSSSMMEDNQESGPNGAVTFSRVPTKDFPLKLDLKSIEPALSASLDGYTNSKEEKPELHSGETKEVTLLLRDELKHFAAGTVSDPDGKPLGGVLFQYYGEDISVTATSTADGKFRLDGLPDPPYGLSLFHGDYGSDFTNVNTPDRTDIEFAMGKNLALLTGIVMDADTKEPIGDFTAEQFVDQTGVDQSDISQPIRGSTPGTFSIQRARTKEAYSFRVGAPDHETTTVTMTVPEGQKEFIQEIELKKAAPTPPTTAP